MTASDARSTADPLAAAAHRRPDAPALVGDDAPLSYAALDRIVQKLAVGFRHHLPSGASPAACGTAGHRRVALLLERPWRYPALLLALWRIGVVACPLNRRTPPAGVADLLRDLNAHALIADRPLPDLPIPTLDPSDVLPQQAATEALPAAESGRTDRPDWDLCAPATLLFTSGSTGGPRPALHSLGNHVYSARGARAAIPLGPGDRWLISLPLYHVGGLAIIFRCLLAGATMVIAPPALSLHEALERFDVTHVSMVPTQLQEVLEAGAPPSLKALLLGGSRLPPALIEKAHRCSLPLHTTYGLTEMASQVTTTPTDASLDELHTAGRLLPHRKLRIGAGDEIHVRGATLFQGYLNGRHLHRPMTSDGWFATGDIGRVDEEGTLRVTGRMDNQFISGGENIYPEEIEGALARLVGVLQALVVPVPDTKFGARPVAFVQVGPDGPALEELPARLSVMLPRYKVPDAFFAWHQLPGGARTGGLSKPDRKVLKAHAGALMRRKTR